MEAIEVNVFICLMFTLGVTLFTLLSLFSRKVQNEIFLRKADFTLRTVSLLSNEAKSWISLLSHLENKKEKKGEKGIVGESAT